MQKHTCLIAARICGLTAASNASLVAWYKFDEEAVTTGAAHQFNDADGYADLGSANFFPSINANGQLTFSARIQCHLAVRQTQRRYFYVRPYNPSNLHGRRMFRGGKRYPRLRHKAKASEHPDRFPDFAGPNGLEIFRNLQSNPSNQHRV